MGVYEDRTHNIIVLKCYFLRGSGEVEQLAGDVISVLVKAGIGIENDIPKTILDRFELALGIKYTVENLEAMIIKLGLSYLYPEIPLIVNPEKAKDTPI